MTIDILGTPDGEELADIAAYDHAKAEHIASGGVALPPDVSAMMLKGMTLPLALRKRRGLTQAQLADASGIQQAYLSDIETRRRHGSAQTLAALARALDVPVGWLGK